jgi:hypothetical protein
MAISSLDGSKKIEPPLRIVFRPTIQFFFNYYNLYQCNMIVIGTSYEICSHYKRLDALNKNMSHYKG